MGNVITEAPVSRIWRRWRQLGTADRLLLCEASGLLALAGLGLRILSFSVIHRLLMGFGQRWAVFEVKGSLAAGSTALARHVSWAVMATARRLPRTTCLAQALVADTMLRRRGCPTRMYFGVKGGPRDRAIEAHAWVDCDGFVVTGALPDLAEYQVLSEPASLDRAERVQAQQ